MTRESELNFSFLFIFLKFFKINLDSRMSELKSRIYYTETAGTQTDHAGLYQQIEPSITMPISHYNKLASGYYHNAYKSTHSHGSTTGHSMSKR